MASSRAGRWFDRTLAHSLTHSLTRPNVKILLFTYASVWLGILFGLFVTKLTYIYKYTQRPRLTHTHIHTSRQLVPSISSNIHANESNKLLVTLGTCRSNILVFHPCLKWIKLPRTDTHLAIKGHSLACARMKDVTDVGRENRHALVTSKRCYTPKRKRKREREAKSIDWMNASSLMQPWLLLTWRFRLSIRFTW